MPRGVYARRSAQQETAVKARRGAAAKAPAPRAAAAPPPAAAPAPAPAQPAKTQFSRDDFRRSIDDMSGAMLKAYARSIGILQRDVDALTEDRLRQNCKARIAERHDED